MGAWIGSPGGGTPDDNSVSTNSIQPGAVTEEKLDQGVIDQLGGGSSTPFKYDSVTIGNTKTTLQLTGLDLNTDKRYQLSGSITQDGTGSTDYYLRANGVATNLATLRNRTSDGSSFAFDIDVEYHRIKDGSIYAAFFFRSDSDPANSPVYTGVISNLTSIEIVASAANRIGQYSYIDCWRMVGLGEQGPQGEQGPAGGGAEDFSDLTGQLANAQVANNTLDIAKTNGLQTALNAKMPIPKTNTLGSAAASLQITGLSGLTVFSGVGQIETNAASNSIRISVNGELTSTGYTNTLTINGVTYLDLAADSQIGGSLFASGVKVSIVITGISRRYDGSNTHFNIHYHTEAIGFQMIGRVQRIVSGDVALSSIEIWSNQANGLKAGAKLDLVAA